MHAQTVDNDERVPVSVVFLRSPMALASFGRPSVIGASSVPALVIDSKCCSAGKMGGAQTLCRLGISLKRLGVWERGRS